MTENTSGTQPEPTSSKPPVPYWENPAWQQSGWVNPASAPSSAAPNPAPQASKSPSQAYPNPYAPPPSATPPPYGPPAQWGQPAPYGPPAGWAAPPRGRSSGLRTTLVIVGVVLLGGAGTAIENAKHNGSHTAALLPAQPVVTVPIPAVSSPPLSTPQASAPAVVAPAVPAVGGATASSPITASSGTQIFADGFTDASSGWLTGTQDGITYGYTTSGYEILPTDEYTYVSYAPYDRPISQLSMSLTASEQAGGGVDAGFGTDCVRDIGGSTELRYQFLVDGSGRWWVQRFDGVPSETSYPQNLRTGSSPATPGVTPVTATAVCATLANGTTTRLLFFINGKRVADLLDTAAAGASGWLGAILSTGDDQTPTTIDVRKYSERDLGAPSAAAPPTEPGANT